MRGFRIALAVLALSWLLPTTTVAQEGEDAGGNPEAALFPTHAFLLTGYGSAGYRILFADSTSPNDFLASVNPILLFQISDRFLFEIEIEFELAEGVTETGVEYAQIDYNMTDNFKLVAGKSLLPFNIFSERLHPTWITRFTSPPPIYGHHGGAGGPAPPMLPILSDVGVQLRGAYEVGRNGYLTTVLFVSQGPNLEEAGHDEAADEMPDHEIEIPEVVFGANFEDNNEGKMVGGRVGFGVAPYIEVNLSAMSAEYDPEGTMRFTAYGAHLEGRHAGFELHSEWVRTRQELPGHEIGTAGETFTRDGYFARLGYRYGAWEPLVRWTKLLDSDLDGETIIPGGSQVGFALAYWIQPSLLTKIEYIVNSENGQDIDNNRLAVQWAFGF